jgi:type II secretion system protein J
MPRPRTLYRATAAFTLLELIIATAIGAIVLIVSNTTFFSALRLHNTTHQKIDDDLVIQRTLGIVRRDLAGIMVPPNPQATTNKLSGQLTTEFTSTNELDGSSERVTPDLYTNSGKIDGWTPYAEVQMVSYYLSPTPGGAPTKDLVRVITRNLLAANDTTVETQTLLTGVNSAALSYYDGENWLEVWDSTTSSTLPAALKFSLVLAPNASDAANGDLSPIELVVPVVVKTTTTLQEETAVAAGQQ